ncbi:MAG: hypothetical protein ACYCV6_02675 [Steroidobacteraceae bacterium]
MKTEPASPPSPLPSADMLLGDEVVFRHKGSEGRDVQVRVPLAVGLLYAANALRGGETFALGYPDDRIGRIVRSNGAQADVHKDAARTFGDMVAFLERYTAAVVAQVRAESAGAGQDGSADADREQLGAPGLVSENFSPPSA